MKKNRFINFKIFGVRLGVVRSDFNFNNCLFQGRGYQEQIKFIKWGFSGFLSRDFLKT